MKKLIIGMLILGSFSSFAQDSRNENINKKVDLLTSFETSVNQILNEEKGADYQNCRTLTLAIVKLHTYKNLLGTIQLRERARTRRIIKDFRRVSEDLRCNDILENN
jgi:hypothetical protein